MSSGWWGAVSWATLDRYANAVAHHLLHERCRRNVIDEEWRFVGEHAREHKTHRRLGAFFESAARNAAKSCAPIGRASGSHRTDIERTQHVRPAPREE
jgi:hypothetical protein